MEVLKAALLALVVVVVCQAQVIPTGAAGMNSGIVAAPSAGGGGGAPSGAAGGSLAGTYPNPSLATGACTTTGILDGTILVADFATGAVTSVVILDGTIVATDMATGAVTSTVILDSTILAADLATGAVTTTAILDATIGTGDIATSAITTALILNGTILAADFATGAVDTAAILNGTILAADFATGAVDTAAILDGTVSVTDLNTSSVDARYCTLTGCTMTAGTTYSGVTTDITAASGQDVRIVGGASTGGVQIQSIDDATEFLDSAGNVEMTVTTQSGAAGVTIANIASGGAVNMGAAAPFIRTGNNGNVGGTSKLWCATDRLTSTIVDQFCVYGEGKVQVAVQQAATCAAGVLSLDPTSSVVYLDAGGAACAVTFAEGSARVGTDVLIVLTANVSGAVTFPNVSNVHVGPTCATTTGLSTIGSVYRVHYAGTLNAYVGVACTNN